MLSRDGLLTEVDEKEDSEILSMPRFRDFYKQYLADKEAMLSSSVKVKGEDGKTDWYIIPLPWLKDKPVTDK